MARLLVIGGPTATGKTNAAIHVACLWGARIVSADAMLVYRGMDIGTAKPPPAVLRRYPHGAVDVREPHEDWSIADFLETVEATAAAHERVVVVGGTPFYLSALVQPLTKLPSSDPVLRAELEALPDPHARLREVDPARAAALHPNDRVRLVRALEIFALSGRPMSAWHAEDAERRSRGGERPVELAWLDRDPAELDARIAARLERMMARGYLDEVARLISRGYGPETRPMRSLGYQHLREHLHGELDLDEAVRRTLRDTRRLARKQRTWGRSLGVSATDRDGVLAAAERAFGPRRARGVW